MECLNAKEANRKATDWRKTFVSLLPVLALMVLLPNHAMAANPVTDMIDWVGTQLTTTWARSVAIIACAVMGYMAWIQRLQWQIVIFFILGCVFIFGAAAFVDTFSSEGVGVGGWN